MKKNTAKPIPAKLKNLSAQSILRLMKKSMKKSVKKNK